MRLAMLHFEFVFFILFVWDLVLESGKYKNCTEECLLGVIECNDYYLLLVVFVIQIVHFLIYTSLSTKLLGTNTDQDLVKQLKGYAF